MSWAARHPLVSFFISGVLLLSTLLSSGLPSVSLGARHPLPVRRFLDELIDCGKHLARAYVIVERDVGSDSRILPNRYSSLLQVWVCVLTIDKQDDFPSPPPAGVQ